MQPEKRMKTGQNSCFQSAECCVYLCKGYWMMTSGHEKRFSGKLGTAAHSKYKHVCVRAKMNSYVAPLSVASRGCNMSSFLFKLSTERWLAAAWVRQATAKLLQVFCAGRNKLVCQVSSRSVLCSDEWEELWPVDHDSSVSPPVI